MSGNVKEFSGENKKIFKIHPIGYVENSFFESDDPEKIRKEDSHIVIYPEYEEGLYRIEEYEFLNVIFYFHKSSGYSLKRKRKEGEIKGVFASRSPHRPCPLGLTLVKLMKRERNRLKVKGLDAINGTPVLDIKPYVEKIDSVSLHQNF